MKTILYPLLCLYCLAYMALAREVRLAWDTPPAAEFVTSYQTRYPQVCADDAAAAAILAGVPGPVPIGGIYRKPSGEITRRQT